MTRLAVAYFVALAGILLMADFGLLPAMGDFIDRYPPLDKVIHFFMYGTLALLANAALAGRRNWPLARAVATGSLMVMVGSTLEEYSNVLVAARCWSLGDLAANQLGTICLGVVPFVIWQQKRSLGLE